MMSEQIPVITIDGPSGTGKGTICHLLALHLNWHVLDSGCIYRVLAYAAKKKSLSFEDVESLVKLAHDMNVRFEASPHLKSRVLLDNQDVFDELRTEECGQDASKIAVIPKVRDALLERQRAFATPPGLVTDGRDMGTLVFPKAQLKIFLYASEEKRAERRYLQLKKKGIYVSIAQVINELAIRDARDRSRECAPLIPAEDAIQIDTSDLTVEQVFDKVVTLVNERLSV